MLRTWIIILLIALIPIKAIADINADFIEASTEGRIEEVRKLLNSDANPNAVDKYGSSVRTSPLYSAAGYDHIETAQVLIDAGADVNAMTNDGWTAIRRTGRIE